MARKQQEEESGGSWMDTYGDMVTLLLTFFVMLYSMSTIVDEKWTALVSAFKIDGDEKVDVVVFEESDLNGEKGGDGVFVGKVEDENPQDGTIYNSAIDELYEKIMTYIDEHELSNSVLVQQSSESEAGAETEEDKNSSSEKPMDGSTDESDSENAKNIFIQFKDNVIFEPDRSEIKPESEQLLQFFGECLSSVQDDVSLIMIKGHTAKSPTSTVDSRLLSSERAGNISNFLEHRSGISSDLLLPMGLGNNFPIADNDTEEGRAQNRRVEIAIINKNSELARNSDFLKAMGATFDTSSKKSGDNAE
ncbi:MAG: flagellar motor protein MotB [Oscillospiraceae bacterium]|nr:flagellar motor protein MotB [Oscillospiraceae bacterium]